MKKLVTTFLLLSLFLNIISIVSATSTVEFTYDFNKTFDEDTNIYYTEAVQLIINTPYAATCYYTTVSTAEPSNAFDINYGTQHEYTVEDLDEGLHEYFIMCDNNSNPTMEVNFRTKKEVSAHVQVSEEDPLKDGTYDINVVTTKPLLEEPTLEYSFDGTVYDTIPLEGSGTTWSGHLIIDTNPREVVASFRFEGTDLEGKKGTQITGDKVFLVDTKVPNTVNTIDATGYLGEIELSWFLEEEVDKFNIYRSQNPGVDFTDFYLDVEGTKDDYSDTAVTNGKTYYYKIAAVDFAGNIASFSREVEATALLTNTTSSEQLTGLSVNLIGKVDNLITEINLLSEDIEIIQNSVQLKGEKEQEFFSDLKLDKEYSEALSELSSLKKDVERYKLQDLSEDELNRKINSAQVRMDIIKKRVPESITLVSEGDIKRETSEEKITNAVLEYGQESLTDTEVTRTIRQTQTLIEESDVKIESSVRNLEIVYLDGTRKEISLFKDKIQGTLERDADKKLVLVIPKEVAETASEITFSNLNYEVIKEDPVLSFDIDTGEITYTIEKHTDTQKIEDIILSPIHIYEEDGETAGSLITGFAVSDAVGLVQRNLLYVIPVIVFVLLMFYFIHLKRKGASKQVSSEESENTGEINIEQLITQAKAHKEEGKTEELEEEYKKIQEMYKTLTPKEKKKYFPQIKELHGE